MYRFRQFYMQFSVFRFWMIFSTVFRFLIGPNVPLLESSQACSVDYLPDAVEGYQLQDTKKGIYTRKTCLRAS